MNAKLEYRNLYYDSYHWRKTKERILKRDEYTCQRCGKKGSETNLEVHHISYGTWFYDVEDKYLITLCSECHRKIHLAINDDRKEKKYGN